MAGIFLLTLLAGFNFNPVTFQIEKNRVSLVSTITHKESDLGSVDSMSYSSSSSHIGGQVDMTRSWGGVGESVRERGRENETGGERESGTERGREDSMESESASFSTALDRYLERGGRESHVRTSPNINTPNSHIQLKHIRDTTDGESSRGQRVSGVGGIPDKEGGGTVIQNRIVHYGVYCGPGPADAFSGINLIPHTSYLLHTPLMLGTHVFSVC